MILETLRKIFGCYSDQIPAIIYLDEQAEKHTVYVNDGVPRGVIIPTDEEQKQAIAEIVANVVAIKKKGFISYTEEAMDAVTDNRYRFIKYRNPCPGK
jgi:predicted RNA-binding protein (virulence factor B family)